MTAGEVQRPVLVALRNPPVALARPVLVLGGLSLLPLVAACVDLPAEVAMWARNSHLALFLAAGVAACIWLGRIQRALVAIDAPDRVYPSYGLWVMWVVPLVGCVISAQRLMHFDAIARAVARPEGAPDPWRGRLWQACPWAAGWFLLTFGNWSDAARELPISLWTAWVTIATFALWVYIVIRLTRSTGAAVRHALRSPSTSR